MPLTKQEKYVLRLLLEKELEHIKKDSKKLFIINSPFFGKLAEDEPDLLFLKNEVLYLKLLERLKKKV
ncbi:hypothetical protein HYX13_05005 [Candidatus Woesearchaeota archaeon]|nr:hypothetical protein [Candidatus Woesearchaeota archaeon]